MASATYYLKYRPQKVSELDSVSVRENLQKILEAKNLPHALLFSGPKGTGKTSAARIVAKAINCLERIKEQESGQGKKVDFEPCNKCEICQEITNGSSLDVIEIDAASNRGIDDIRNLREKIKLSPNKCRYKVYIIDEVHMLTTEAFNALLKTLEEPPAHAIFILCTTEPEKLPKTIISRCLQIKFQKAKKEELINSLKRVVKGEKLDIEEEVLKEISNSAEGSFRDAQKVLDQLSLKGGKITLKEARELLGKIEEIKPEKLLLALSQKEAKEALLEIDHLVNFGADLEVYTKELLENLRWLLLKKAGLNIWDEEDSQLKKLEEKFEKVDLLKLIGLFSKAALETKTSPIAQLPLELAVVEWCESEEKKTREPLLLETRAEVSGKSKQNTSLLGDPPIQKSGDKLNLNQTVDSSKREPSPSSGEGNLKLILEKWDELLAGVRPLNHSVEALLRAARPVKLEGNNLTLEVFYKFHKERLESEKCRSIVEEVAGGLLGLPIRMKCILGEKKKNLIQSENKEGEDILDVANEIFNGKIIDE
jgi:DNA polymerase-3 subunit gamma/tau